MKISLNKRKKLDNDDAGMTVGGPREGERGRRGREWEAEGADGLESGLVCRLKE